MAAVLEGPLYLQRSFRTRKLGKRGNHRRFTLIVVSGVAGRHWFSSGIAQSITRLKSENCAHGPRIALKGTGKVTIAFQIISNRRYYVITY